MDFTVQNNMKYYNNGEKCLQAIFNKIKNTSLLKLKCAIFTIIWENRS